MIHSVVIRASLHYPDALELHDFLKAHLHDRSCMIQVAGECEISYSGRAASTAGAGDYLIIIKKDKCLQVHGPNGVKPINWQPRTDCLTAGLERGRVALTAERHNPSEVVRVLFLQPALALALTFRDSAGFLLNGSEAEMRAALVKHPEFIEPGLKLVDEELPVGVGDIDLYAVDQAGRFVVVELKRSKATQEAVHQLQRYVQDVRAQVLREVRGVLVAPGITTQRWSSCGS
jgi:endonuclease